MMCLTFDDGYCKGSVQRILNTLRKRDVRATLFVIGNRLLAFPDLWRRAVKDGHEIAYHSMNHACKTSFTCEQIKADLQKWKIAARRVLGNRYTVPRIARLPGGGGHNCDRVLGVFNNLGYTVIGWSADTLTGAEHNTPQSKAEHVLKNARVGAIQLQHFIPTDSLAVEIYIDHLIAKQIPLGLVSEALAAKNCISQPVGGGPLD
jgi:peptidoglycan/xylan/chitin deacetylase (PgdA/CDA1 family)